MNKIGKLIPNQPESESFFWGHIRTLDIELDFWMEFDPDFSGDGDEPSYIVFAKNKNDETVAIGAGWHCISESRDLLREYYITIEIDDPTLPHALILTASTPFRDGDWRIFWDRDTPSPFEKCHS